MAYRHRSQRGYRSDNGDYARQHIEEAAEFTREMGGVDEDVKKYFFDLPPQELRRTLLEYRRAHGDSAADYALQTFNSWRTGARRMSGLVAKRLFALLPKRMPLSDKYALVESLWRLKGPRSSKDFTIGNEVTVEEIQAHVKAHFNNVVQPHQIPGELIGRFSWLSDGDVGLQQQLYNHFTSLEQPILIEGLAQRLPLFLEQIRHSVGASVVQNLRIGNHEVNLHFQPKPGKITAGNPQSYLSGAGGDKWLPDGYGCIIWLAIAFIIFYTILELR